MPKPRIVILGAGPAGLGAAYKLACRKDFDVTVVERNHAVGGNAGSFELAGLRVDFGSHRLHPACASEILTDIRSMLGERLVNRPRHGRIRLRGQWVHFPLKPIDLIMHLPLSFSMGVVRDSVMRRPSNNVEESFASVLERGLGRTVCREFYFPYARKIWGIAPEELDAEQARRRVSAGSLSTMLRKVLNGVPGCRKKGSSRFFYPTDGYGAISEAYCRAAGEAGAAIRLGTAVTAIERANGRAVAVHIQGPERAERLPAWQILSTIPISVLVHSLIPKPPADVLAATEALQSRAMILAYLVLDTDCFTEFDAHYFPEAKVAITRLSEPKNYGLTALPNTTVLCAELPCSQSDPIWQATDGEIGKVILETLASVDLPVKVPVRTICTRRLTEAYPVYARGYHKHFDRIDNWLNGIEGLVTFGRQGLFAHDNTHHALAMAYAVADCLDSRAELETLKWKRHRISFQEHVVED